MPCGGCRFFCTAVLAEFDAGTRCVALFLVRELLGCGHGLGRNPLSVCPTVTRWRLRRHHSSLEGVMGALPLPAERQGKP